MSIDCMSWVWKNSISGGNDRLVLLAIADQARDEDHSAWPSVKNLAKKANVSARTVQRCIRELISIGELRVEEQAHGRQSNTYIMTMEVGRQPVTPVNLSPVTPVSPPPMTPVSPPHDTVVTQIPKEPSVEPKEDLAAPPPSAPTPIQRAQAISRAYAEKQPMSKFPAILDIVRRAMKAGHSDESILGALLDLANEGRSVTVETLRIQLEGQPAWHREPSPAQLAAQKRAEDAEYRREATGALR